MFDTVQKSVPFSDIMEKGGDSRVIGVGIGEGRTREGGGGGGGGEEKRRRRRREKEEEEEKIYPYVQNNFFFYLVIFSSHLILHSIYLTVTPIRDFPSHLTPFLNLFLYLHCPFPFGDWDEGGKMGRKVKCEVRIGNEKGGTK